MTPFFKMSNHKTDSSVRLTYTNWNIWDRYVKSTICWKNAYIAFDPKPVDPSAPQQVVQVAAGGVTTTPAIMVAIQPTAEEMKAYREELKEWKTANN